MTRWSRCASRSPKSRRRCGRSSAPEIGGVAAALVALLFFTVGTRTPFLALLALRRPRNLAAAVLPFVALGIFARVVGDPAVLILAFAPAPLVAERVARAFRVREETVGALTAATVFLSFPLLVAFVPGLAPTANMGLFAFVLGAVFAGALPTIRDTALPVLDGARYASAALLLAAAALSGPSLFDWSAALTAAGTLAIGTITAAVAMRAFGGDAGAAAVGAGLRDASVCAGLALVSGLAGAGPLVLAYVGLVLMAAALRQLLVRGKAGREALREQGQTRGESAGR